MAEQHPLTPGVSTGGQAPERDGLRRAYYLFSALAFDPVRVVRSWRALPYYIRNALTYARVVSGRKFRLRLSDLQYATFDRFLGAGTARGHYFLQDLWAARWLYAQDIREHVDVASRVDGFVAHLLTFCRVTYVDIRPLPAQVAGLSTRVGSLLSLPFADASVPSLSCLHVIEHVGLGRYGDPVDPEGFLRAAAELERVVAPSGHLLIGTPVGRERLCFDAHRVFDPATVVEAFAGLELREFHLITDAGDMIHSDASFADARQCNYGCGLFVFRRPATS